MDFAGAWRYVQGWYGILFDTGASEMAVSHASKEETLSFLPPAAPTRPRTTHVRGRVRRIRTPRSPWQRLWGFLVNLIRGRTVGSRRRVVLLEGIERDPRVFGGAARIAGTRIPVFFLEDIYLHEEGGLEAVLSAYPSLSAADVFAAMSYSHVYPAAVERDRRRYFRTVERRS